MKTVKAIMVHNFFHPFKDPVSILAKAIQLFGFYYNHCEILIDEGDGKPYVIGAVFPKIRKLDFEVWKNALPRDYRIMDIQTTRTPEHMIAFVNAQVGRRYDRDSLLIFMPFYLLSKYWFGWRTWIGRKGEHAKNSNYCFELLANTAGWDDCHNITPKDVMKKLY
jgi:hypothetical protein